MLSAIIKIDHGKDLVECKDDLKFYYITPTAIAILVYNEKELTETLAYKYGFTFKKTDIQLSYRIPQSKKLESPDYNRL